MNRRYAERLRTSEIVRRLARFAAHGVPDDDVAEAKVLAAELDLRIPPSVTTTREEADRG